MPEFYLHYLWLTKQIVLFNNLTSNGSKIEIIDFGKYNYSSSGPDFYDVVLKIDGLFWCGSVEMHVKSSDWYVHNHHTDKAYEQVILHVVYENNQSVFLSHGELLTLELKEYVNQAHVLWFKHYYVKKDNLPCQRLSNINYKDILLVEWENVAIKRVERKVKCFENEEVSAETVLYKLVARSFGGNTNQLPFEEIVSRISLDTLLNLTTEQRIQLIYQVSGLLELENEVVFSDHDDISSVQDSSWKRKGQRHHSHPVVRVKQFAVLMAHWPIAPKLVSDQYDQFLDAWKVFFTWVNQELQKECSPTISKSYMNHIIINALVPYLFFVSKKNPQTVRNSLKNIPAENNSIIRKWKEVNQVSKNALQSQGSIAYFADFCLNFKCLRCRLGQQLIYGNSTENNVFF